MQHNKAIKYRWYIDYRKIERERERERERENKKKGGRPKATNISVEETDENGISVGGDDI